MLSSSGPALSKQRPNCRTAEILYAVCIACTDQLGFMCRHDHAFARPWNYIESHHDPCMLWERMLWLPRLNAECRSYWTPARWARAASDSPRKPSQYTSLVENVTARQLHDGIQVGIIQPCTQRLHANDTRTGILRHRELVLR
jgi:hypothetical protein